jgi:hypothetical protein
MALWLVRVLAVVDVLEIGVVAPPVVVRGVLLDDLAVLDHTAPGARLDLLHLDEGLEAMEVGPDRALHVAHSAGRLL